MLGRRVRGLRAVRAARAQRALVAAVPRYGDSNVNDASLMPVTPRLVMSRI